MRSALGGAVVVVEACVVGLPHFHGAAGLPVVLGRGQYTLATLAVEEHLASHCALHALTVM